MAASPALHLRPQRGVVRPGHHQDGHLNLPGQCARVACHDAVEYRAAPVPIDAARNLLRRRRVAPGGAQLGAGGVVHRLRPGREGGDQHQPVQPRRAASGAPPVPVPITTASTLSVMPARPPAHPVHAPPARCGSSPGFLPCRCSRCAPAPRDARRRPPSPRPANPRRTTAAAASRPGRAACLPAQWPAPRPAPEARRIGEGAVRSVRCRTVVRHGVVAPPVRLARRQPRIHRPGHVDACIRQQPGTDGVQGPEFRRGQEGWCGHRHCVQPGQQRIARGRGDMRPGQQVTDRHP